LEFAGGPMICTRTAIRVYHQGYSDRVFIHLQDASDRRFSVLVEPFLPSVEFYDRYVDFDE
jgi:hypothetical protein